MKPSPPVMRRLRILLLRHPRFQPLAWHLTAWELNGALTEGLAQYYTHRTLERLKRDCPGALRVSASMLARQPSIYRAHEKWVSDYSPEAVRQSMLEVRRSKERTLEAFEARLARAQLQLRPVERTPVEDDSLPESSTEGTPP